MDLANKTAFHCYFLVVIDVVHFFSSGLFKQGHTFPLKRLTTDREFYINIPPEIESVCDVPSDCISIVRASIFFMQVILLITNQTIIHLGLS